MRFYHKDGYRYLEFSEVEYSEFWNKGAIYKALKKYLFHPKTHIQQCYNHADNSLVLKQRMTRADILFRKFNWPYVPEYIKRKRILMRRFR